MGSRVYRWRAFDDNHQLVRGETIGKSAHSIRQQLIIDGFIPLEVKADLQLFAPRWPRASLATVTRQLATMLQAGLPLISCLQLLSEGHPQAHWRHLLDQIRRETAQGKPFSQVLRLYPHVFPILYCELIQIGELTGELDTCCAKLAEQQEKALVLQKKIRKALSYPLFVLSVAVLVTLLMLVWVLPEFTEIYQSFDAPLPAFTQAVIGLSDVIRHYGVITIVAVITTGGLYHRYCRSQIQWRLREQNLALKLPLIGQLIHIHHLAALFQILALTQRAGMTLCDGLNTAGNAAHYQRYQQAVLQIKKQIEQGASFYRGACDCEILTDLSRQLIQAGEESGALEGMLVKLAEVYEKEVETQAENMTQMLEPLLMLVLGVIVGSLVIAMYLPIFQLGNVMG